MSLPTSINLFITQCNAWKPDDTAGFAMLLKWAVTNLAIHQRDLAGEYEVSPSSISRWSSGASSPHPRIQAFIVSSLRKRASMYNGLGSDHDPMKAE